MEYQAEPGALNESYSDIFGVIVSNRDVLDPQDGNWELGEELGARERCATCASPPGGLLGDRGTSEAAVVETAAAASSIYKPADTGRKAPGD